MAILTFSIPSDPTECNPKNYSYFQNIYAIINTEDIFESQDI